MSNWQNDPLEYLIGPNDPAEFFKSIHEQKALKILRQDPERYKTLLSLERIDEIIASLQLEAGQLDMARSKPPIGRGDYTFDSGMIDRGAVAQHFQEGATIIMPHLQEIDPTLAGFCRAMENVLSQHVQTNVYLTPPGNQGFKIHYDDHDVFVLQISGKKKWRFYNTPIENPFRGEAFNADVHKAGDPVEEFIMNAGDCIYVPRGLMHDAETEGDEPSLHITMGLIVKTWADLMIEAISEVALRVPEFRRSLPVGFARGDYDRSEAESYFKLLVEKFAKNADFEESFELFIENFIRSRAPQTTGAVISAPVAFTDTDRFRIRPNTPLRLRSNGDKALIIAPGGEIPVDAKWVPGLEVAFSGDTFGLEAFDNLEPDMAAKALKKIVAFGLVEPA